MSGFKDWLFGSKKPKDESKDKEDKMDVQEVTTTTVEVTAEKVTSPRVESLKDVQNKIAEMAANPHKFTPDQLQTELAKMSQALAAAQASSNIPPAPQPPVQIVKPIVQRPIPQSQRLNSKQAVNEAGGYSFKVCDFVRLKRFLVIGTENGTFYTSSQDLNMESLKCVSRLIQKGHGIDVLNVLEKFSTAGRIAKEDPILISLAICATCPKAEVQKAAYERIPAICNIPTKLFLFLDYCQKKINGDRKSNPPKPQPSKKRPHLEVELNEMKIDSKGPSESLDLSTDPQPAKKQKRMLKKKEKLKKVNVDPKKSSGWGRMRRRGIASFYTDQKKGADRLLYLVTKYKQRHNWSHKQVLGYAHPKIKDGENKIPKDLVLTYATRGYERFNKLSEKHRNMNGVSDATSKIIGYIDALEAVSKLKPETEGDEEKLLVKMKEFGIRTHHEDFSHVPFGSLEPPQNPIGRRADFQIVREHIPTAFLKSKQVWEALLVDMPMTALIRNLGKMSSLEMFGNDNAETNKNVKIVQDALLDAKRLQRARVHPIKILIALRTYQRGMGDKGSLAWQVNLEICKYLDKAFYLSFTDPSVKDNFKTNKKYMLCLDVSGSMTWQGCYGCEHITPAMASVAMAMVTWNIEDNCDIMAFGGHFESLGDRLKKDMTLDQALRTTSMLNFGATDCSLPMIYAKQQKKDVDVFIVYTDSDTWAGRVHPPVALKDYNDTMKKNAKLIVCAMQSNSFTIADPNDPNMMDMCGFDTSVPDIIAEFAKGSLSNKCDVCEECKTAKAKMEKK